MDRQPLAPFPVQPFDPAPGTKAAIDAFARRLDDGDPMLVAFRTTPAAMVVADPTLPDCPIIHLNARFERLTGFPAVEVLGRNCRFMQGPLTEADDVRRLREAIARREPIEIDILNHRRDGTPFWNRLTVAPVFADGGLRYFVGSQIDVTAERYRVQRLEQDREALAAEVARRDADLAAHDARLRMALRAGGLGTWTLDLPGRTLRASSSYKRNFGRPAADPFTYEELLSAIHPDDLSRVCAATTATIEQGAPYHVEYRIRTPSGEQRWISVQGELQHRADGSLLGLSGFSTDISDRKFAEAHRAILARELTHRVKNMLATVNAVVAQTLREAASPDDAATVIAGRIASLAAAHDLLIQDEIEGAAVGDIVRRVLAPFGDRDGTRFAIHGPVARLSPDVTLALSMTLHELATNAVKYGALSVPDGRVAIGWSVAGGDGERRLAFRWSERDGPAVEPPRRAGFGTRMIERVLRRHARGGATLDYRQEGVRFEVEIAI